MMKLLSSSQASARWPPWRSSPPRAIRAVNEPLVTETPIAAINSDDTMTEAVGGNSIPTFYEN
jgi:hypothetical protein